MVGRDCMRAVRYGPLDGTSCPPLAVELGQEKAEVALHLQAKADSDCAAGARGCAHRGSQDFSGWQFLQREAAPPHAAAEGDGLLHLVLQS